MASDPIYGTVEDHGRAMLESARQTIANHEWPSRIVWGTPRLEGNLLVVPVVIRDVPEAMIFELQPPTGPQLDDREIYVSMLEVEAL